VGETILQVDGDKAHVELGRAVAWAGDINGDGLGDFLVAAPKLAEEVRVYYGSTTSLAAPTVLRGSQPGEKFGTSVASAGDINGDGYADVLVGAPMYADTGGLTYGAAYLFLGGAGGLSATPEWTAEGSEGSSQYGLAVSSAGDVNGDGFSDLLVGSPGAGGGTGSVSLYVGSAGGVTLATVLDGSGQFGRAVASAGDVNGDGYSDIIVGAPFDANQAGTVTVFLGNTSPRDGLERFSHLSGADNSKKFGESVASAGDYNGDGYSDVIVGAPAESGDNGAVYLYVGGESSLSFADSKKGWDDGRLGADVAAAGDVNGDGLGDLLIGMPADDWGRAAVYFGNGDGLLSHDWWRDAIGGEDLLGAAVSAAGDINGDGFGDLLIGMPGTDDGEIDEGRAVLILGASQSVQAVSTASGFVGASGMQLGRSLAFGDFNADGFDTLVIGAPGVGQVQFSDATTLEVPLGAVSFGAVVRNVGDVDGNGYPDLLVGAPGAGAAFLYLSTSDGVEKTYDARFDSNQDDVDFALAAGGGCDVNGDGLSDMVIGAPRHSDGEAGEGAAFLVYGTTEVSAFTRIQLLQVNQAGAQFGTAVACAGDLNGDGFGDLAVGAPGFDDGETDEGAVFVYFGTEDNPSAPVRRESNVSYAAMGTAVAGAGDTNGDGLDDLIVGAPDFSDTHDNQGRIYLYLGAPAADSGLAASAWTSTGESVGNRFGASVSSAGDTNGDGLADVIVGADGAGRACVFLGDGAGSPVLAPVLSGASVGSGFGAAVAAGDTNGDGFSDVAVGAPLDSSAGAESGRVSIFLGNNDEDASSGTSFAVRAVSEGKPVPPWGAIRAAHRLGLEATARSPFGSSRAKLQVEVEEHPLPFEHGGFHTGNDWQATGLTGVQTNTQVRGLAYGTAYRWRARLLYDPALAHPQGWSHWFQGGVGNAPHGVHLRTAACQVSSDLDDSCDLIDDDCDGSFDEDFSGAPTSCGLGVCAKTGVEICEQGTTIDTCQPGTPTTNDDSNCNGLDEDCDGDADEDYIPAQSSCGVGACVRNGVIDCIGGATVDLCTPGSPLADTDTSCDGIDDDCDGFFDEEVDLATACGSIGPCDVAACNPDLAACTSTRRTGCCESNSDCGATSTCVSVKCDLATNTCTYERPANCCVDAGDCDDGNACTEEECIAGTCSSHPVPGCCNTDADCVDLDSCTLDECLFARCRHRPASCGNDSPCGDDSACWYSELVLSRGPLSPEGVRIAAGEPAPLLQLLLRNEAAEADLAALRLTPNNWNAVFAEVDSVTVRLFADDDGDGAVAAGESALASVTVEPGAKIVELSGIQHHLPAATERRLLVVAETTRAVGAGWLLPGLLILSWAVARRRRLPWAMAGALLLTVACTYNLTGLRVTASVSVAAEEDVEVVARDPGTRVWVRGAPVESHSFAAD
jgi:hypothetical protein